MAQQTDALLIAQKLVTSLLMEDMERGTMPFLVVKSKRTSKRRQDKNAESRLGWLDGFYDSAVDIESLQETTVAFDMVKSYSVAYSGSLAEHTMFDGATVADNFKQSTTVFNVSAKISTTSTLSSFSVRRTADILKEAFTLGLPVYLSLPDLTSQSKLGVGITGLNPKDIYGIITNLNISRDNTIQDGFNISMTISQPKFSKQLQSSGVIKVTEKSQEELTADFLRDNPEKQYDSICGQQLGVVNSIFGKARRKSELMPPEIFKKDLDGYLKGGADPKKCDVTGIMKTYTSKYNAFGKG